MLTIFHKLFIFLSNTFYSIWPKQGVANFSFFIQIFLTIGIKKFLWNNFARKDQMKKSNYWVLEKRKIGKNLIFFNLKQKRQTLKLKSKLKSVFILYLDSTKLQGKDAAFHEENPTNFFWINKIFCFFFLNFAFLSSVDCVTSI